MRIVIVEWKHNCIKWYEVQLHPLKSNRAIRKILQFTAIFIILICIIKWNRKYHIVWNLDLQLPIQSLPITTDVVSFESRSGWGVQHMWFSPGPPVSSNNKTDRHDIAEILLKVASNTIKQTNKQTFSFMI